MSDSNRRRATCEDVLKVQFVATALLSQMACSGCMATTSVYESPLSRGSDLTLRTHVIAGVVPNMLAQHQDSGATALPYMGSTPKKYNPNPILALTGVGWSVGSHHARGLFSGEFSVNEPYCRGVEIPALSATASSEFRYACAAPTHRFVPQLGGLFESGNIGFEAGAGVPLARLLLRRGIDNPQDPATAPPNERYSEFHAGWSLHFAVTTDAVEISPPFGLAYRFEQYPYDAFGGGRYTSHMFVFYSNIYHKEVGKWGGPGHSVALAPVALTYMLAPILAAVFIFTNALCDPNTNPTC